MKVKPLILITSSIDRTGTEFADLSLSLSFPYTQAIEAAGGVPVMAAVIPDRNYIAQLVGKVDGIVLTGGDDIAPRLYGRRLPERLAKTVQVELPERDAFELALIREVLRKRKPLFAICRGHQLLNVALGGTLVADIQSEVARAVRHNYVQKSRSPVQTLDVLPGSLLHRITGQQRLRVNSTHHQAVAKVAKYLRVNAVSKDGTIEGLELGPAATPLLPWLLAVQFHPERLFPKHAEHFALFRSFVRACHRHRTPV